MTDEKPSLTDEEIKILKQIIEGHKAMKWIRSRSTAIATWLSVIIAAYLAVTGQISSWIKHIANGG